MTTFLTIFRRFPTTFRRFPKIFQNFSEGQTNVSEDIPKIAEKPKISAEEPMMFRSYSKTSEYSLRDYVAKAMVIILSSRVKISCLRAKAHLIFHWCLYNKYMLLACWEVRIGKNCDRGLSLYGPTPSRTITCLSFFLAVNWLTNEWVCLRKFVIELAYAPSTNHS